MNSCMSCSSFVMLITGTSKSCIQPRNWFHCHSKSRRVTRAQRALPKRPSDSCTKCCLLCKSQTCKASQYACMRTRWYTPSPGTALLCNGLVVSKSSRTGIPKCSTSATFSVSRSMHKSLRGNVTKSPSLKMDMTPPRTKTGSKLSAPDASWKASDCNLGSARNATRSAANRSISSGVNLKSTHLSFVVCQYSLGASCSAGEQNRRLRVGPLAAAAAAAAAADGQGAEANVTAVERASLPPSRQDAPRLQTARRPAAPCRSEMASNRETAMFGGAWRAR
mmetsp:Transcript_33328/g.91945  ORF Transcript_33328/g.91945 Transcript_33328/m.91945 type:complete len:279 (+) Transcript_33328:393-1229(+)